MPWRPSVLPGLLERGSDLVARSRNLLPDAIRETKRRLGSEIRRRRENDSVRGESLKDRLAEMLPHLVETQSPCLALGVASRGTERREVVVSIRDDDLIEIGSAGRIGGTDERMQRERDRAIATRELIDEHADACGLDRIGHCLAVSGGVANGTSDAGGFFGGGVPGRAGDAGGLAAFAG